MKKDTAIEQRRHCRWHETDVKGRPDLCCCYIMDAEGNLQDPCNISPDRCRGY